MRTKNYFVIASLMIFSIVLASCNGSSSAPAASLKSEVDSVSYAYGVNLADQGGLIQYLEQSGLIQSATNIEYDYQMRIAAADSTQKAALQKEMKSMMDYVLNKQAELYDKHFTEQEIDDILNFYKTPAGKKVIEETPKITKELFTDLMENYYPDMIKRMEKIK